ncbi:hypothetical protein BH10ACT10_BH10ACT10_15450 [soil metagenome]
MVILSAPTFVYLLQVSAGTYVDGGLLDVGWALAFAPLGLAAWSRPGARAEVRGAAPA